MSNTTYIWPIVDPGHPNSSDGNMTTPDEIRREVRSVKEGLLGPKTKIRIGTWNVRTMWETTKTAQVLSEMKRYHLDILGISESHWIGSGRQVLHEGSVILHSGHENTHTHGVAILISKEKAKTLLEWEPVSERLIQIRLNSKFCKLTILQCYAPTNEAEEEVKKDW